MPGLAQAATVKVCADYQVQYDDADFTSYDDAIHGDYFYTNSDKVARGAKIGMLNKSTNVTETAFADWDGTDAGCATFTNVPANTLFDIRIWAHAEVRGNKIKVYDDEASPAIWFSTMETDWSHTFGSGVTYTVLTETLNAHEAWNVAAAAGHAMWRRTAGLSNKTFEFYTDNTGRCGGGSCMSGGDVFLSSAGENSRFITVHEMGHAVEHFVSGGNGSSDYTTPFEGVCITDSTRAHELASKEWQSAAIREGWAHFYAAVAFNQTTDPACGFVYYKSQDYDLDGSTDGSAGHGLSCELGPDNLFTPSSPPTIPYFDYLGEFCNLSLDGHATELDWLRFWWDLLQEESTVNVAECADILGTAIEGTFQSPTAPSWIDDATSSDPAYQRPTVRMRQAAIHLGLGTEWDDHYYDNGVDR